MYVFPRPKYRFQHHGSGFQLSKLLYWILVYALQALETRVYILYWLLVFKYLICTYVLAL